MKKVSKLLIMSMSLFFASCGNNAPVKTETDAPDCVAAALAAGGKVDRSDFQWTREPASFSARGETLAITTATNTDVWEGTCFPI